MEYKEYEIAAYQPELKHQICALMQHLWRDDEKTNLAYFNWKYVQNPATEQPLGIVALYRNKVVGFRGYFATRWFLQTKKSTFTILCPGDTCVHPEHRRQGLSVAMGKLAVQSFSSDCKFFLNLSSTPNSVPGYLQLGFEPLQHKYYISKFSYSGLLCHLLNLKQTLPLEKGAFGFGQFGRIIVSDRPMPREMNSVADKSKYNNTRIRLYQDEDFFKWRYNNTKNKYIFYYFKKDTVVTGYIVMGVSPNNRRGYILDYDQSCGTTLETILCHIINTKQFDILSIYSFGAIHPFLKTLNKLKFRQNTVLRTLEKRAYDECPLLIRPIKMNWGEREWFIQDKNVLQIENWAIKPIASDAV